MNDFQHKSNMRNIFLLLLLIVVVGLSSCTEQTMAKSYGGDYTLELPAGQKLVTATWKDVEFWYLTRPMRDGEEAETYYFKEDSNFGIMEGTVTIVERK